jgi:hypothetical protein
MQTRVQAGLAVAIVAGLIIGIATYRARETEADRYADSGSVSASAKEVVAAKLNECIQTPDCDPHSITASPEAGPSSRSFPSSDPQTQQLDYLKNAKWRTVEADNGFRYMVDVDSVRRLTNGNVMVNFVLVMSNAPSVKVNPTDVQAFIFDCQGNFQIVDGSTSMGMFAPYNSVAARVAQFVCRRG